MSVVISEKILQKIEDFKSKNLLTNRDLINLIEAKGEKLNLATLYIIKKRGKASTSTIKKLIGVGINIKI
jgi:hypothetical protein